MTMTNAKVSQNPRQVFEQAANLIQADKLQAADELLAGALGTYLTTQICCA